VLTKTPPHELLRLLRSLPRWYADACLERMFARGEGLDLPGPGAGRLVWLYRLDRALHEGDGTIEWVCRQRLRRLEFRVVISRMARKGRPFHRGRKGVNSQSGKKRGAGGCDPTGASDKRSEPYVEARRPLSVRVEGTNES
jgi:hypothetical protein